MGTLLMCPAKHEGVERLADRAPLALLPLMGQTLLEYWLAHLAAQDCKSVTIVAEDRADQVKALCGSGKRWGMEVRVDSVRNAGHEMHQTSAGMPGSGNAWLLDRFPGSDEPLFESYRSLFVGLERWISRARTPERVGVHEIRPGVYVELRAHVAPSAVLRPPCWIGRNAFVGPGAIIGPAAVLEAGAFIEKNTEVIRSYIGPDTFVGRFAQISNSYAWASTLVDWETGSATEIPDPFLLCGLRGEHARSTDTWFTRLTDVLTFATMDETILACRQPLARKES